MAGVGPDGCEQVVVVVEDAGKDGLARRRVELRVRAALAPQPVAAVLAFPQLPVDRRHNSKIDRTRLGRWAEKPACGRGAPEAGLMRVLVTGGPVSWGRTTIAALASRGHEVGGAAAAPQPAVECDQVLADVVTRAVAAAAAGCDAVIHGAARVGVVGIRAEFRRVNVGGTRPSSPRACRRRGASRVVSSPSVGLRVDPTVVGAADADHRRRDHSWYSESKGEAELDALAANGQALAVTASGHMRSGGRGIRN